MGEIMATDIDEKLLEEILTDLEKARSWTPRTIAKLESLIHAEDEFALFRIDPIRFADEKKVSEAEAIDLAARRANLTSSRGLRRKRNDAVVGR